MKLLAHILCLCLALALAWADEPETEISTVPDRCEGLEMDAVTVNEEGTPYFFKGDFLFKGFQGLPELFNETFAELDDLHHLDHVDAAFIMHYEESPTDHDRVHLFLDDQVFIYFQHKLEEGYPKNISEVFPGIPDHLDAAVECPKSECEEDSVIFFKGHDIYHYNVKTKAVHEKDFISMPNCTSAFRFMENYYCFHGHMFSKFDPKTGFVHAKYPKEARDYFMRCSKFSDESDDVEREQCSRVHFDAIAADSAGNTCAFRGHYFLHKEVSNGTLHAHTIESAFKELHSDVDAVFCHNENAYMIKGDHIFVYNVAAKPYTLLDGYPKPLKEELGFDGPVNAAFVCEEGVVHVVKGQSMISVDMKTTPPATVIEHPIFSFKRVDAAYCHSGGLEVIVGNHYYHYESPMLFATGKMIPEQHKVSMEMFGCDH
ncbi:hemopexin [Notolabrus celidotus]|uniref:hemopexin n=1 Tax=Notolabrus celidotus TaxID=1203425 RepID=UPI0014904460|nr:hemopexin [Notolabrus celidotus]